MPKLRKKPTKSQSKQIEAITDSFMAGTLMEDIEWWLKIDWMAWYKKKKYESVEDMDKLIQKYFDSCLANYPIRVPVFNDQWKQVWERLTRWIKIIQTPTMWGLAFTLWMSTRSLLNYSKSEKFFLSVSSAKSVIEYILNMKLAEWKDMKGVMSCLMNNYWWKERRVVEQEGVTQHQVSLAQWILDNMKSSGKSDGAVARLSKKVKEGEESG